MHDAADVERRGDRLSPRRPVDHRAPAASEPSSLSVSERVGLTHPPSVGSRVRFTERGDAPLVLAPQSEI
jgi:hypothetical protein